MSRRKGKGGEGGGESASANKDHNAKERQKIIREVAANITHLEAQIAGLRENITEERGRIKSLGIRAIDFNTALRLSQLEADDKDKALDGLREAWEALGQGDQLDFISAGIAGNSEDDDAGEANTPHGPASAAGAAAGRAGKPKDNPFPLGTKAHKAWDREYDKAQKKNAAGVGTGAAPVH